MTKQEFIEKMVELGYSNRYSNNLISWMKKGEKVFVKWSCNHFTVEANDRDVDTNAKGIIKLEFIDNEIEWYNSETDYLNPETNKWDEWNIEVGGEWDQDVNTIGYFE